MDPQYLIYTISSIKDKAYKYLSSELEKNGIIGLVPSHGAILFQLYKKQKMGMKEIADGINRRKSTVTTLVEKLIKLGYVKKEHNENDRRGYRVSLTEKGKTIEPVYRKISRELILKAYTNVSDAEKKQVMDILVKVLNNF